MNDPFEKTMKDYFSDRTSPSPETKARLEAKLYASAQCSETKWIWPIVLYTVFFSAVLTFTGWLLTGNNVFVFIGLSYLAFSSVCAVLLALSYPKAKKKGGFSDVVYGN